MELLFKAYCAIKDNGLSSMSKGNRIYVMYKNMKLTRFDTLKDNQSIINTSKSNSFLLFS